ncbi:hypothetical protein BC828DRAFT_373642 [Blastocladiella britannica]|nr:hypothetical protein BC828DRAFT_373642 [Blastocladiella britannica]
MPPSHSGTASPTGPQARSPAPSTPRSPRHRQRGYENGSSSSAVPPQRRRLVALPDQLPRFIQPLRHIFPVMVLCIMWAEAIELLSSFDLVQYVARPTSPNGSSPIGFVAEDDPTGSSSDRMSATAAAAVVAEAARGTGWGHGTFTLEAEPSPRKQRSSKGKQWPAAAPAPAGSAQATASQLIKSQKQRRRDLLAETENIPRSQTCPELADLDMLLSTFRQLAESTSSTSKAAAAAVKTLTDMKEQANEASELEEVDDDTSSVGEPGLLARASKLRDSVSPLSSQTLHSSASGSSRESLAGLAPPPPQLPYTPLVGNKAAARMATMLPDATSPTRKSSNASSSATYPVQSSRASSPASRHRAPRRPASFIATPLGALSPGQQQHHQHQHAPGAESSTVMVAAADPFAHLNDLYLLSQNAAWWAARFALSSGLAPRARRPMYIAHDLMTGGATNATAHGDAPRDPVAMMLVSETEGRRIQRIAEIAEVAVGLHGSLLEVSEVAFAACEGSAYPSEMAPEPVREAVVVMPLMLGSVADRARLQALSLREAKLVLGFIIAHMAVLAQVDVGYHRFKLDYVLIRPSTFEEDGPSELISSQLVLGGYHAMYVRSEMGEGSTNPDFMTLEAATAVRDLCKALRSGMGSSGSSLDLPPYLHSLCRSGTSSGADEKPLAWSELTGSLEEWGFES